MVKRLWEFSEPALRENRSAEYLAANLAAEGFSVERGVGGLPTAFTASYGSGRPVIGVLAEFDALAGTGNEPVASRTPREDGVTAGHGCGHNAFGGASVGAAIAIKRVMQRHGLNGTVRLYGTPAEETLVGKVYMAKSGLFDDLDAAIHWHAYFLTETFNEPGLAMNNFEVEFFGRSAHGAEDPWNGRSALDAVELLNSAVNLMREHIEPSVRIHYVIVEGGEAPNVVPDYAKAWYYVRAPDRSTVEKYYDWLQDAVKGAALGTQTRAEITLITGVHETLINRSLQEAMQANLEYLGPPVLAKLTRDSRANCRGQWELKRRATTVHSSRCRPHRTPGLTARRMSQKSA